MDLNKLLPVPPLEEARNLLVVMPHPDDNEIMAGGTLAKLAARGARITYLGVTDGSAGSHDPAMSRTELARIRKEEQAAAMAVLGVERVEWLEYPDAAGLPTVELRGRIVEAIRRLRPDFVMTVDPWLPYEVHPDHRETGMAVAEAVFFSNLPAIHPDSGLPPHAVTGVAFYGTAAPNTCVNIDRTFARKLSAIGKHVSQFPGETLAQFSLYLDLKAQEMAVRVCGTCRRAEAFRVLTTTHMHTNVDPLSGRVPVQWHKWLWWMLKWTVVCWKVRGMRAVSASK